LYWRCAKFHERSQDLTPLCQKAIALFGTKLQLVIAVEELNELATEIARELRGTGDRGLLLEELVDVDIMLTQLKEILFNEGHLNEYLAIFQEKMDNLEEIIEGEESKQSEELFVKLFMDRTRGSSNIFI
jgi:hypothetical protein